ncbi:MAG: Ig-like domain-containing protein [Candidatus Cohnella colombiensis]|uniref:Ig-like domain-containing protein n=1 Tax=Candidatus Cohnella colombiensis TaxID=3121368 RepID=A0AA95JDJ2_9BACL|nr:MAG: Ig-like domain-containing protein [Cohnella sp.]
MLKRSLASILALTLFVSLFIISPNVTNAYVAKDNSYIIAMGNSKMIKASGTNGIIADSAATSATAGNPESFLIVEGKDGSGNPDGSVNIKSIANNNFLTAEDYKVGSDVIQANGLKPTKGTAGTTTTSWEKFYIEKLLDGNGDDTGLVAIKSNKSVGGKKYYLTVNTSNPNGPYIAISTIDKLQDLTINEKFMIHTSLGAPTAPATPHVDGSTNDTVKLSWAIVARADSYNVFRSKTSNGTYTKVNTSAVTATSFDDTGLPANAGYYYKITAMSIDGESAMSAAVSAATLPDQFGVSTVTTTTASLAWPTVPGANSYNVYRSTSSNGNFDKVNTTDITTYQFDDSGLSPNTRYYYKVTSVSGNVESPQSVAVAALTQPDFGKNVFVFDPAMPAMDIATIATNVFTKQETNQFGSERYALLFKPGTYSTPIRVGFYTHVAGLGMMPDDVQMTGGVTVDAAWFANRNATQNFWRSIENLAITPVGGDMKYAVSQAASMRRLHVKGNLSLHDQGGWASGGYLADSKIDGRVIPGSQQQWFSRNNTWNEWAGSLWNMTLVGNRNNPIENYPTNAYTIVEQTPVVREKPFLTVDANDKYSVFVPVDATGTIGTSWESGSAAGTSIPIDQFYIADVDNFDVDEINAALNQGKNLLLTPGVYHVSKPIVVNNPNTVVLGLGLATLHSDNGSVALKIADVDGVKIAGLLFEAGSISSPVLLEVGPKGSTANHSLNPTSLQDLYFRVGGDALALAEVSIEINSNNVIGDHFWVWRADHGEGAAWNSNLTKNGLIVNGNDVTIYGLFVEHFHEYQTLWNGERGKMYFYQCEIPYDVPDQESWMSNYGTVNGYAGYKVADSVNVHEAYGLGVYSFFRDVPVKLESAIEVPDKPGIKIHHANTVFLNGFGEVTHIVNSKGGTVRSGNMTERLADYIPRTVSSITEVNLITIKNKAPILPEVVWQVFDDTSTRVAPVTWDSIAPSKYAIAGSFTVEGSIANSPLKAKANVTVQAGPGIAVTSIAVIGAGNATSINERRGELQMSAQITPANADQKVVNWSIVGADGKATTKATISSTGLLSAIENGTVKVIATATDGTGVTGEATITITNQFNYVSNVTVTAIGGDTTITTKSGKLQLAATVLPLDADNASITWSVVNVDGSATDKASINAYGLLTARQDGTVKVIASSNDGSNVQGQLMINIVGQTVVLDTAWSWVRESQSDWATVPNNAYGMRLTTIEGSWGGNKPSNILLRNIDPAEMTNFSITTKLNFDATNGYEYAGLIIYQDDGNAITFGRQANGTPGVKQLRYSQIKNGAQTDKNYTDDVAPGDVYLRIDKAGDTYTGHYSSDGETWTQVTDTFTLTISNLKMGIFTRKLNTSIAPRTAEFTNFTFNNTVVDTIIPFWNPVTSVSITGGTEITDLDGTLQLSASALPVSANQAISWSVTGIDGTVTNRATISNDGLLTANRNGQVKVIATATDGSGVRGETIITITGQPVEVASITITGESEITAKGGTLQLMADVTPTDAVDLSITWSVVNGDGTPTDKATIDTDGLLTAVKDGVVKAIAAANDGSGVVSEFTITISGQSDTGCKVNCGGEDMTSPPTTTPTPPATIDDPTKENQLPVTAADLNHMQDGNVIVSLGDGKSEAIIPTDLVKNIIHPVEFQSNGASIVIPSEVFHELVGKQQGNDGEAHIVVRIETDMSSVYTYNLDVVLISKDGTETKLSNFPEPVQLKLPYDSSMNKDLIGIYIYDEASKVWKYVGGKANDVNHTITVNVSHFSKYAVQEFNKTFADVPSTHWANTALKVLAAKHVITGVSATEFKPNGSTTRAEFVAMLVRALGLKTTSTSTQFSDVNVTAWYAQDVVAALEAGLVTGKSANKFAPNAQITREEMAILLVRAYTLVKGAKTSAGDNLANLKDQLQVSGWAKADVNLAIELGLMKGQSATVFAPLSNAVRVETAQAIYNLMKLFEAE